ncbi:DUF2023 family protein [Xanthobacter sp. V4C-4]|uniref:DUF2023 family protein n=1 Tax=Xanthobacter cornucopiae TaxID=3119924 RepID=UPI00372B3B7D
MAQQAAVDPVALRLFHHHLYEYGRGVRGLFLMTLGLIESAPVVAKLRDDGIDHFVQKVGSSKVNVFFGREAYVAVARSFVTKPLNLLSPEEDFMLGTLLGYDREQQCRRFLGKLAAEAARCPLAIAAE